MAAASAASSTGNPNSSYINNYEDNYQDNSKDNLEDEFGNLSTRKEFDSSRENDLQSEARPLSTSLNEMNHLPQSEARRPPSSSSVKPAIPIAINPQTNYPSTPDNTQDRQNNAQDRRNNIQDRQNNIQDNKQDNDRASNQDNTRDNNRNNQDKIRNGKRASQAKPAGHLSTANMAEALPIAAPPRRGRSRFSLCRGAANDVEFEQTQPLTSVACDSNADVSRSLNAFRETHPMYQHRMRYAAPFLINPPPPSPRRDAAADHKRWPKCFDRKPSSWKAFSEISEIGTDCFSLDSPVEPSAPGHVYALREIMFPPPSSRDNARVRMITSRVVLAPESVHARLEDSDAPTVLCPAWTSGGPAVFGHVFRRVPRDPFFDRPTPGSLLMVAVPKSEIHQQLGHWAGHCRDAPNRHRHRSAQSTHKSVSSVPRRVWKSLKRVRKTEQGNASRPGGDGVLLDALPHRRLIRYPPLGSAIFEDEAVIRNTMDPVEEIVCISAKLGIYICESGLTPPECQHIIDVTETCASAQGYSSYTYAKQTLGCREHDRLAQASERPVMTACATIRKHLVESIAHNDSNKTRGAIHQKYCNVSNDPSSIGSSNDKSNNLSSRDNPIDFSNKKSNDYGVTHKPSRQLVLDVREPHVVKYDLSKKERQKLDTHTDKSEWTFLIALSEGRGMDYGGGGTFFESLGATVHLQRGQVLIFRGKLRHRGVKITHGARYLLVGFLVEQR